MLAPLKTNIHLKISLIISVLVVIPAAFIYGFNPGLFLDISFSAIDEQNFSKGVMGLYLAFASLWCFGLFNPKFLHAALISNALFMLGLGFGRILSLIYDGTPSIAFNIGLVGELVLGLYSTWMLNSKHFHKAS